MTYLPEHDRTMIWRNTYDENGDTKAIELLSWYFGVPSDCKTIKDVESHIMAGLTAVFD